MELNEKQKGEVESSKERQTLTRVVDAIKCAAENCVQDIIARESNESGAGISNILNAIGELGPQLGRNNAEFMDSNGCPHGQRWDPVQLMCVNDQG